MSITFVKKAWKEYGLKSLLILLVSAFCANLFYQYLSNKGLVGAESNSSLQPQYLNTNEKMSGSVKPSSPDSNSMFASLDQSFQHGETKTCSSNTNVQNPADLLPNDENSQWAQLNPSGQGELSNVNLLNAGHHIGIDTVGQSLRNANLQLRSEPPNPQMSVGPWNNTTIEPDSGRPNLEIGN